MAVVQRPMDRQDETDAESLHEILVRIAVIKTYAPSGSTPDPRRRTGEAKRKPFTGSVHGTVAARQLDDRSYRTCLLHLRFVGLGLITFLPDRPAPVSSLTLSLMAINSP